jgi:hypothetical protein
MIKIEGKTYDLSKCERAQLQEFAEAVIADYRDRDGPLARGILEAARVETKDDVAREIAERVELCWRESGRGTVNGAGVVFHDRMRDLAERYRQARKAVDQ